MTERWHEEAQTSSPSLWNEVAAAGQRASAKTRGLPGYQRATAAARIAATAGCANTEMIKSLCAYIEELEGRLTEAPMIYAGTWKPGQTYPARTFITFGGSIWYTADATDRRPGEGAHWVLACKKGADAKERT